ncbi:Mad3/BUB1 homology region 1-domain-containing protein [Amylostereum chailletii]|nr:Mad3/BUB1 homology region 1-domain-containing protein [Amylostereum chailletii]
MASQEHISDVFTDSPSDEPVIVDGDVLEAAKENIQPIASGRRATTLSAILSTPHAQRESKLAATRNRLRINVEVALEDEDDDPLEAYCQIIYWTVENYPQGHTTESGLLELLEEATRVLKNDRDGLWKGDMRYLKLWVLYASNVEKPATIFKYLLANEIGTSFALLYEELAIVLERNGRQTEADTIYLLGINRQAQPLERLQSKHREFQKRMMISATAPERPPTPPQSSATSAKRKVLGESSAPSSKSRSSRATSTSTPAPTTQPDSRQRPNARMQIFVDPSGEEAQAAQDASNTPWEELGTRKARVKENIPNVSKAGGTTLKQVGRHQRVASAASGSRIPVFRDPGSSGVEVLPPPAPAATTPKTPARSGFAPFKDDESEGPSTLQFTPFKDEPDTPTSSGSHMPESVMKTKRVGGRSGFASSEAEALRKDPFKNYTDKPVDAD